MVVLLVIIYIAFISLGLPDALLGSAWPVMYEGFGVSISSAGVISMIITGGTIISSLMSDRLIRRLKTGMVTLVCVAVTAIALLGISFSTSFAAVCLWAIPLGLGAGSVDAALNNFVALHYKAAHMNWLHSFWGVGASVGPIIMSILLMQTGTWTAGYRVISIIQFALVAALVVSLPLWKKVGAQEGDALNEHRKPIGIPTLVRLPGAKPTLIALFCYCALEMTVSLWGSTYLVMARGVGEDMAAGWIALFFLGITVGRMVSGFMSLKFTTKSLIFLGELLIAAGVILVLLPLPITAAMVGLLVAGFGCAPIYPSMLHETPNTFGKEYSQAIMGIQMACAYVGTTFMPPLFGLLGAAAGYGLFPFFLAVLLAVMAAMVGMVYRRKAIQ